MEISSLESFLSDGFMADAPVKNPIIEELKKREALVQELRSQSESLIRQLTELRPFDAIRRGEILLAQELQMTHKALKQEYHLVSKRLEEAEKSVNMAKERVTLYEEDEES